MKIEEFKNFKCCCLRNFNFFSEQNDIEIPSGIQKINRYGGVKEIL